VWRGFARIFRGYFLQTRPSKQPIREILGYKIIPSNPLKYPRSKQALNVMHFMSLGLMASLGDGIHKFYSIYMLDALVVL
jgi:hypothetical protein